MDNPEPHNIQYTNDTRSVAEWYEVEDDSKEVAQDLKPKQHFFYVAWQDQTGTIIDIKHYDDYDMALMRAMQNAKATGTTYTIRDLKGRLVDSNYVSK